VLEHAPVSLLLDVLQILASGSIGRILLAHVTQATGEFGEPLAIGTLAEPADLQVIWLQESRARQKRYDGFGIVQGQKEKETTDRGCGRSG